MAIKKAEVEKAPNEFDFEKVKGFGAYNFVWHNTKVLVEDASLSVAHTRKIMFGKGKTDTAVVNYGDLERVETKGYFTKGDLISGIIIGIIGIVTAQFYGLLVTAFLVFFSYGRNIVFARKDGSKVIIQYGGPLSGGGKAEFERMVPLPDYKNRKADLCRTGKSVGGNYGDAGSGVKQQRRDSGKRGSFCKRYTGWTNAECYRISIRRNLEILHDKGQVRWLQ
jgi:hypothetical protein